MHAMTSSGVGWRSCRGPITRWPASSILAAATILAACTAPEPLIKTVDVPVTKYVRAPIDAKLLVPCVVTEPDRGCWREDQREFCNGQLVDMLADYRAALAACDSQIHAIGASQPSGNAQ